MNQSIDHEKKSRLDTAKSMQKVPLLQLDKLIKERHLNAQQENVDAVEYLNQMIKELLGL